MNAELKSFQSTIGYTFRDSRLLSRALTHSSFQAGKGGRESNERLEFLGDSVLSVVVSDYLYKELAEQPEGQLTKLRASIVCEQSLFRFARKIGLGERIQLGKGEENTGGRERRSILADAFEALIAAIYLDGGIDEAKRFILPFLPNIDVLKSGKLLIGDYKTLLQEIIQKNPEEKITYQLAEESGAAHNKTFFSNVLLNGQVIGSGSGGSKKEAEQMAAKEAIGLMGYATE